MQDTEKQMHYRIFGNTGFQFRFCPMVFATFGVKEGQRDVERIAMAKNILIVVCKGGIKRFDNAYTYGLSMGEAERVMGEELAK